MMVPIDLSSFDEKLFIRSTIPVVLPITYLSLTYVCLCMCYIISCISTFYETQQFRSRMINRDVRFEERSTIANLNLAALRRNMVTLTEPSDQPCVRSVPVQL